MYALPIYVQRDVVGILKLLRTQPGGLTDTDRRAVHVLAEVATIALLQAATLRHAHTLLERLRVEMTRQS